MELLPNDLLNIKGLFKGKEKRAAQAKLDHCRNRIKKQKDELKKTVKESGYAIVKSFMDNYNKAYVIVAEYQEELKKWKRKAGEDMPKTQRAEVKERQSV